MAEGTEKTEIVLLSPPREEEVESEKEAKTPHLMCIVSSGRAIAGQHTGELLFLLLVAVPDLWNACAVSTARPLNRI